MEKEHFLLLGRIDGKLDAVLAKQDNVDRRLDSHSSRIKALEESKSQTKGFITAARLGWAALAGGIGYFSHLIVK